MVARLMLQDSKQIPFSFRYLLDFPTNSLTRSVSASGIAILRGSPPANQLGRGDAANSPAVRWPDIFAIGCVKFAMISRNLGQCFGQICTHSLPPIGLINRFPDGRTCRHRAQHAPCLRTHFFNFLCSSQHVMLGRAESILKIISSTQESITV